jgi:hypothetical protein
MNKRGPSNKPRLTASCKPKSAPAASRTVVKPRISMPRMMRLLWADTSEAGCSASLIRSCEAATTCTWASISPGSTARPPASITLASST